MPIFQYYQISKLLLGIPLTLFPVELLNFWAQLFGSVASILAILYVAKSVTEKWEAREDKRREIEFRPALSVSITVENVYTIKNVGKSPVQIKWYESITPYKRERNTNNSKQIKKYFDSHKGFLSNKKNDNFDDVLYPREEMLIPINQEGMGLIEEEDLVVQLLGIRFTDLENNEECYDKYICTYWLTDPKWQFDQRYEKGLSQCRTFIKFADPSIRLNRDINYLKKEFEKSDTYKEIREKWGKASKTSPGLPQNRWYVFKIETNKSDFYKNKKE